MCIPTISFRVIAVVSTAMHVLASDAARRSLFLLLLALIVAVASWLVLSMNLPCVAASSAGAFDRRGIAIDEAFDEVEDDEDWDFMDDDAILGLSGRQNSASLLNIKTETPACVLGLQPELVDDDYCDCQDGSDEPNTSACSHVLLRPNAEEAKGLQFICKADGKPVAVGDVGDGVCDCCDGSDERDGVCANTCSVEWTSRLQSLQERLRAVQDGEIIRKGYAARAVEKVTKLTDDFKRLTESFSAGQRAFEDLQRRAQEHPELQGQLEQSYHVLRTVQYVTYVQSRVVDVGTFSDAVWKPAFSELVGQCFPFTVDEKQLKGGTPNVIPREYVVVLCPFQNVTQTEPNYPRWAKAERETKIGAAKEEDEEVPRPISLGIWNEWLMEDRERSSFVRAQQYNHGEPCSNGQERQVRVEYVCGVSNRVLTTEETEMCVYEIRFETPAACSAAEERAALDEIKQVEQFPMSQQDTDVETRAGHEEL